MSERGPKGPESGREHIESLLDQYVKIEDDGIPQKSLDLVMADGRSKAVPANPEARNSEKYIAYKTGDVSAQETNNLPNMFMKNRESLNRMLTRLRELGEGSPEEVADILEDYFYRESALYYLVKNGDLRQAFTKLGADKTERLLKITRELDQVDVNTPDAATQTSGPEYEAKFKERNQIAKELYVILYDMGLNMDELDK